MVGKIRIYPASIVLLLMKYERALYSFEPSSLRKTCLSLGKTSAVGDMIANRKLMLMKNMKPEIVFQFVV